MEVDVSVGRIDDGWMKRWRRADETQVARQHGSLRACSRVVSTSGCAPVCVYVCLLSMWASEHGTEWLLTVRQLSWQQRMSFCSVRSRLSQNPTDLSLSSSASFSCSHGLLCPRTPNTHSSYCLPPPLVLPPFSPLTYSSSHWLYLLLLFPAFSNPPLLPISLLLSSVAVTDINRSNKLQWDCKGVYFCACLDFWANNWRDIPTYREL